MDIDIKEQNESWNRHYKRERSRLSYPDENLVRLLKEIEPGPALDIGCGSGRHLALLKDSGFDPVYGMDLSESSIELCRSLYPEIKLEVIPEDRLEKGEFVLPFPEKSFNAVILWGVLHYNPPAIQRTILEETARVLKKNAPLLGTLRAAGDTHFAESQDMKETEIIYYTESEANIFLQKSFENVELGYMERSPIGKTDKRVCHWFFRAKNG